MRKLFMAITVLAIIVSLAITGAAWAQDVQDPTTQKPKTVEELTWQAQALQNEFLYLQERQKTVQSEFIRVQAELKSLKATKPATHGPIVEPGQIKEPEKKGKK